MRDRLVCIVEANDVTWYDAQAAYGRGFGGRCEQDLHADAYAKVRLSGVDVVQEGMQ